MREGGMAEGDRLKRVCVWGGALRGGYVCEAAAGGGQGVEYGRVLAERTIPWSAGSDRPYHGLGDQTDHTMVWGNTDHTVVWVGGGRTACIIGRWRWRWRWK